MTGQAITDEMLMAYADGELDAGGRAAVAAAPGGLVRAVARFTDRDGTLCREMEQETPVAARLIVACRHGADWSLRLALVTPASGTGYAPVGALEAVEAWMASVGASAPLTPEAEAAALAR
ncbi:MAG: hypothetical protein ACK4TB_15665 [Gemmobacter sp.]